MAILNWRSLRNLACVGRIEVYFLPSYSRDLNPDEYLNPDLKAWMSAGEPAHRAEQMK
ncbi:MAG: transposase [Gammaproteobacteria bacterium]|nr:transposase [Gammaproteobacteria bacterium]